MQSVANTCTDCQYACHAGTYWYVYPVVCSNSNALLSDSFQLVTCARLPSVLDIECIQVPVIEFE